GGIWPMIGGFHVAALVRHKWAGEAERALIRLAEANRQGPDGGGGVNEGMHGGSGHPMGFAHHAWSAAMVVYAEHGVRTGMLPLFDDLLAAKPATAAASEINDVIVRAGGGPV